MDEMSYSNPNKVIPEARVVTLLASLFGRACETVSDIRVAIMHSDDAVSMITERIYKRDWLSMTASVFDQLRNLPQCHRSPSERFIQFEARFAT